jgi:transposase
VLEHHRILEPREKMSDRHFDCPRGVEPVQWSTAVKTLVSADLWAAIEPLLPPPKARRPDHPGRKPLDRRKVLSGVIYVLKTGIAWGDLPAEVGLGCGKTCRAVLDEWQRAGVWDRLHRVLLAKLNAADRIDWSRAAIDSASARSPLGGEATGSSPTDRRKPGIERHAIVDGRGVSLAAATTGAHRHDSQATVPLLNALPGVAGKVGRPRRYPGRLYGDRAYDSEPLRGACQARRIDPAPARRDAGHGSGPGAFRWPVERTLGWLHQFRRVGFRRDRLLRIHNAFVTLATCLLRLRFLSQPIFS